MTTDKKKQMTNEFSRLVLELNFWDKLEILVIMYWYIIRRKIRQSPVAWLENVLLFLVITFLSAVTVMIVYGFSCSLVALVRGL